MPAAASVHVGMVAAEASGDLLAAHLIEALKARRSELRFSGIGGARMIAQGFESHVPMDRLGLRGYGEVLRRYREISRIRRDIGERFLRERPAAFIGVDSSDFNLDLERKLKDAGIPAIQYVSPSIWAWRGWRTRRILRSVTQLLALFPFEPALYEKQGLPVTYVGHPLADLIPMEPDKGTARTVSPAPTPSAVAVCGSIGNRAMRAGAGATMARKCSKLRLATSHRTSSVRLSGTGLSSPIATGSVWL